MKSKIHIHKDGWTKSETSSSPLDLTFILKGQGHEIRMAWKWHGWMGLDYRTYLLPPDISLKCFYCNCPFNILFIFKILIKGTHLDFEFQLSISWMIHFPYWLNSFADYPCLFFYWLMNILEFSRSFWKLKWNSKARWLGRYGTGYPA